VRLRFFRLRFHFTANEPIRFPPGNPANVLRGAFGSIFRRIACVPECTGVRTCEMRARCAYARTFEPGAIAGGPSGLADWPRPFVFRASHLDGLTLTSGTAFHFDVNLFQMREPAIAYFILAFTQLARDGLGPGRGRATLARVDQLERDGQPLRQVFDGRTICGSGELEASAIPLDHSAGEVSRVAVRFLTPTELKSGQEIAARPEFPILMRRIRDRLSTLSDLYGDGPLDMDFAAFGRRAERVAMTRCDLGEVKVTRLSTRTGQWHPLDGFVGVAQYEGSVAEFLPFLEAARFAGVGRQTTWGKGEISVTLLP
jgi:hypothetical protein